MCCAVLPASRACLTLKLSLSSVNTYICDHDISLKTRLLPLYAENRIADVPSKQHHAGSWHCHGLS